MTNESGIHPTEFNVLIAPIEVDRKTKGGLLLPDSEVEKQEYARTEGTLIAVSPAAFSYAEWPDGSGPPSPGAHVIFAKYNATEVKGSDGRDYWLVKDNAIAAVIEQ